MAIVRREDSGFNNESTVVWYSFDDVTKVIQTVELVNNGTFGTLFATLRNLQTQAVIYSGSRAFGTGTFVHDVSALGIKMIPQTSAKNGTTGDVLPFALETGWSST